MDFLDLARRRWSCRKYKPDAVPEAVLGQVLEAGRVAPTAHNNQPYHIFAVQSEAVLEKVRQAGKIYASPVVLVVCADAGAAWENSYDGRKSTEIDAAIVTDHMMLAATDLGLSSLWICWFDRQVVRDALGLPENLDPINLLLLGYPNREPQSPDRHGETRKPQNQLVTYR